MPAIQILHKTGTDFLGCALATERWRVCFRPRRQYRHARERWLTESGGFTVYPARALVVGSPEVAAERLQVFVELRGWRLRAVERFALVPAA